MTTIAYNHKTKEIASDSQATSCETISSTDSTKIHRVTDGWMATCGSVADSLVLLEYFRGNTEVSVKGLDCDVFILSDKGNAYKAYFSNNGDLVNVPVKSHWALGSGREYALGALSVGASARDAVKAAIKYDIYSSGKVVVKKRGCLK